MIPPLYLALGAGLILSVFLALARSRKAVHRRVSAAAERLGGKVRFGKWPYYTSMTLPIEGAEAHLGCRYGGEPGQTARPLTTAWLAAEDLQGESVRVQRRPTKKSLVEGFGKAPACTDHDEFNQVFFGSGKAKLMTHELCEALLDVDPDRRVELRLGTAAAIRPWKHGFGDPEKRIEVVLHGIPPTQEHLDQMVRVLVAARRAFVQEDAREAA